MISTLTAGIGEWPQGNSTDLIPMRNGSLNSLTAIGVKLVIDQVGNDAIVPGNTATGQPYTTSCQSRTGQDVAFDHSQPIPMIERIDFRGADLSEG